MVAAAVAAAASGAGNENREMPLLLPPTEADIAGLYDLAIRLID